MPSSCPIPASASSQNAATVAPGGGASGPSLSRSVAFPPSCSGFPSSVESVISAMAGGAMAALSTSMAEGFSAKMGIGAAVGSKVTTAWLSSPANTFTGISGSVGTSGIMTLSRVCGVSKSVGVSEGLGVSVGAIPGSPVTPPESLAPPVVSAVAAPATSSPVAQPTADAATTNPIAETANQQDVQRTSTFFMRTPTVVDRRFPWPSSEALRLTEQALLPCLRRVLFGVG